MACLKILARGNVFVDIYHMLFMSGQTMEVTFHTVCDHFTREMYDEHTYVPTNGYQDKVMSDYERVCLTGDVGSTDVTRVAWGMCPYNQARSFTGKEGYSTIAYQVTVDQTKRALVVTPGFVESTNDKMIIRFDKAVTRIRTDPVYKERKYKLYDSYGTPYEHNVPTDFSGCFS